LLGQALHDADPVTDLNVPSAQAAQLLPLPLAPEYPILQPQAVDPTEEVDEFVAQALQDADPVPVLKLPTMHALQAIPSADAVYPALHTQSVNMAAPVAAVLVFEGQEEQDDAEPV